MATRLGALGDDDVDAVGELFEGVVLASDEGRHLDARLVRLVDDVLGRRAERVDEDLHVGPRQRTLHLEAGLGVRPAQQVATVLGVGRELRDAVLVEHPLDEVAVLLRDHLLEHGVHLADVHTGDGLGLGRHDDVDAVRAAADLALDVAEGRRELVRREPHRTQDSHATGLADLDDDVRHVAEGEEREVDAELVGQWGAHGGLLSGLQTARGRWSGRRCRR